MKDALTLDDYRNVLPDGPDVPVPTVTWHDKEALNRQTGFNRSLLESHGTCGCFHCGHRFPTTAGRSTSARAPHSGWSRLNLEHFKLERVDDTLRFSPWMDRDQAVLLELSERYGVRLKGDLTCNGDHDISLSVFLEHT